MGIRAPAVLIAGATADPWIVRNGRWKKHEFGELETCPLVSPAGPRATAGFVLSLPAAPAIGRGRLGCSRIVIANRCAHQPRVPRSTLPRRWRGGRGDRGEASPRKVVLQLADRGPRGQTACRRGC